MRRVHVIDRESIWWSRVRFVIDAWRLHHITSAECMEVLNTIRP